MTDHNAIASAIAEQAKTDPNFAIAYAILRLSSRHADLAEAVFRASAPLKSINPYSDAK